MTNVKAKKNIFVIWGREVKLSQYLAEALDAKPVQVYYDRFLGLSLPWPLRYLVQTLVTWGVLLKARPRIVYVQNPPALAPLACLAYCRLFGAKLMIDSHTAAFLDAKWVRFYWLFKFVARRADLNSCHNYKNLEILKSWEVAPAMVTQFYNPQFDEEELRKPLHDRILEKTLSSGRPAVLMVNRFAGDDDYLTVIKAAMKMPDKDFFIPGDYRRAKDLPAKLPDNVYLTGYLQHGEFMKLMYRAQVVLAFTKRADTVLWSIREILALRKPFVTTDSEVLRHYFRGVALFASPEADDIKEQIELAVAKRGELVGKMEDFLTRDRVRWQVDIDNIMSRLNK
jgi:glycosyltransferase involved in cell wall biosynthesis